MAKREHLTRICTACGMEKPLSAFLQISGAQGTTYGSICSTCRGTGAKEKSTVPVREEEQSSTSSGIRIGTKQKVELEKQKKREYDELKQQYIEEDKKRDQITIEKVATTEQKEKAEKEHRQTIEAKKQGFLSYQTKKPPLSAQSLVGQKREDRSLLNVPAADEIQQVLELRKVEEAIKSEIKNTTLDLGSGAPVLDQQHNVFSRENPFFKQFIDWLGNAPIARTMDQFYKKQISQKESLKEKPHELAEKKIHPSSRKR